MTLPTKIKLRPEEAKALRKFNDKKAGIDAFIQTVVAQGEARIAELQSEGRQIWEGIRDHHKIDLDTVNYVLDNDGKTLTPTGMKL
jgi:hypothetical protein